MATKKQIIIPIVIVALGFGGFSTLSSMKKPPQEKAKVDTVPLVSVNEVELQSLNLDVESYGVINPKYQTELIAQVSGEIVSLSEHFVKGGFIKKGQLLATIDPNDYEAALIEAESSLASARSSLELEKAQGKVAEREWQRIKDTTPSELSLRKPQLAQEMARVDAAEAMVKRARRNLERTKIVAPYDAMISGRQIGLGSYVSSGRVIGEILNVAIAEVRLPVADNQLQYLIDGGLNSSVILTSKYAGLDHTWNATIVRSEGVIDTDSRMNYLVAEIQDPYGLKSGDKALRYGSYVNAIIEGVSIPDVAMLPRYLVDNNQVAVMDIDNKLLFKNVTIYRQQGKNVVISDGLDAGDLVITSALDFPLNGMQLSLIDDVLSNDIEADTEVIDSQLALKD
ncbi:efflux RND transporter periplasmic adaptor subunit [Thalassotalea crassostreae]|uniref:efflux RND transporter periplasmic adaptor subunit n=1 Tax=Thalassotalea crassostreae TaxID=1763536 RepID=UPI000838B2A7|nr:efflux RND transporter periplasmic adaptor subunit [Thalassotalea crassostreae]